MSSLLLIILSPLFLVLMTILSLSGEREVFYMQRRIGYKNGYFDVFKFATMVKNSLIIRTGSTTLRDDPRVTNLDKVLRKAKINELPQLLMC